MECAKCNRVYTVSYFPIHLRTLKHTRTTSRERQYHGLEFEDIVIRKEHLIKNPEYTGKFDAWTKSGVPVQIKYIKRGSSIDMGDLLRNSQMSQPFMLYIGFWDKTKSHCVEILKFFINDICAWNDAFMYAHYGSLKAEMRLITNLHVDDNQWKSFCERHKRSWNQCDRHVQIRFKRDHKKQKRIQCAINQSDLLWFKRTFSCEKLNVSSFIE